MIAFYTVNMHVLHLGINTMVSMMVVDYRGAMMVVDTVESVSNLYSSAAYLILIPIPTQSCSHSQASSPPSFPTIFSPPASNCPHASSASPADPYCPVLFPKRKTTNSSPIGM